MEQRLGTGRPRDDLRTTTRCRSRPQPAAAECLWRCLACVPVARRGEAEEQERTERKRDPPRDWRERRVSVRCQNHDNEPPHNGPCTVYGTSLMHLWPTSIRDPARPPKTPRRAPTSGAHAIPSQPRACSCRRTLLVLALAPRTLVLAHLDCSRAGVDKFCVWSGLSCQHVSTNEMLCTIHMSPNGNGNGGSQCHAYKIS